MANRDTVTLPFLALVRPHQEVCAQFCCLQPRLKRLGETGEGLAGCGEDSEGPRAGGLQGTFEGAGLVQCGAEESEGRANSSLQLTEWELQRPLSLNWFW